MMPAALEEFDAPLAPAERNALIEEIAGIAEKRGLQTPLFFALEIHRPLGFVFSQGVLALTPLLGPLIGIERMKKATRLLGDASALDALIERLAREPQNAEKKEATP